MTKLRKHVNRSHIVNECEFCKKIFYDKAEFTKHKKTEHVEGKFNYFFCRNIVSIQLLKSFGKAKLYVLTTEECEFRCFLLFAFSYVSKSRARGSFSKTI